METEQPGRSDDPGDVSTGIIVKRPAARHYRTRGSHRVTATNELRRANEAAARGSDDNTQDVLPGVDNDWLGEDLQPEQQWIVR